MKELILAVFIFAFGGLATAFHAQQVNTLFTKQLPEAPGKEIEVVTVNYAPRGISAVHRHDAHALVYVLQEKLRCRSAEARFSDLVPGRCFYESPEDVHTIRSKRE
jgi:quercetin dioxygenase-like cupin family protein